MINHISIGVQNPEKVANVLAELWNGMVLPFPPSPNSFIVLANDGKGTAVEVTPINTILVPGDDLPLGENFDDDSLTGDFEAKFVQSDVTPQYVATHLNINTNLDAEEVLEIGKREGWRTLLANRDRGLFQLIELWIEDRFMLEVMTPRMTARYLEITDPAFLAQAFQAAIPNVTPVASNLNLVG